jgi:hypothetical protein
VGLANRETVVICPKCGEDNSDKFRFCGMCGTLLEPRRPGKPLDPLSAFPSSAPLTSPTIPRPTSASTPMSATEPTQRPPLRPVERNPIERNIAGAPEPRRQLVAEKAAARTLEERPLGPSEKSVPPISGPSMLGLNQPVEIQSKSIDEIPNRIRLDEPSPKQFDGPGFAPSRFDGHLDPPRFHDLSGDSLRRTSFSGLDSYIEPESPKRGAGRFVLLLLLLAGLGAAGWWAYNNYVGLVQSRRAKTDTPSVTEAPVDSGSPKPADSASGKPAAPAPDGPATPSAVPTQSATPPSDVAEGPSENASPAPGTTPATPSANNAPARPAAAPKPMAKSTAPKKVAAKHEPAVAAATASRMPAAEADTGDAAFRKAEAYLYGRGAAQNCDEAVKNLKAASAKSNARARSTFGTMYATGHCVPRDLPTSYLWFALALRADPSNQILEKDLTAVWNQMTPPERQMAARMKQ